ncbi:hypothetical protein DFA_05289 [Cavenderia fasciculata]|uniref:Uncharacterized protein n=1 Tax=Cavenderia fasciculata TaxID=261658 RepID=F4PNV4_CACFS|nr:uncharacterized protein DFA_05289 [Cavenderia fasciculata]EGG23157.1 hypothetical protein DFA_05289 [Cavenderia fasciculata]|eukprot:XP_004361008.1 hypothetical protein DFA_05289 [Cavenderia fasciculata]
MSSLISLPILLGLSIDQKSLGFGFNFDHQNSGSFIKSQIFVNDVLKQSVFNQEFDFTIIKDQESLKKALDILSNDDFVCEPYMERVLGQYGLQDEVFLNPKQMVMVYSRTIVSSIDELCNGVEPSNYYYQPHLNFFAMDSNFYIKKIENGSKCNFIISIESDIKTIETLKNLETINQMAHFMEKVDTPSYNVKVSSFSEGFKPYKYARMNCVSDLITCLQSLEAEKVSVPVQ